MKISKEAYDKSVKSCEILTRDILSPPYDLQEALTAVVAPTLLIHGEEDPIPFIASKQMATCFPNAEFVLIPECGHFPFVERPNLFFEHFQRWIEEW